jgi:soluble lytic murein transglycosylase-like protein
VSETNSQRRTRPLILVKRSHWIQRICALYPVPASTLSVLLSAILLTVAPTSVLADDPLTQGVPDESRQTEPSTSSAPDSICQALATAAAANELPLEFFTRLIWQESRFNPDAVSRAGAQGVAQFMPGTARLRGLENPFDPLEAIAKSAQLLRDLHWEFGNLGLAAAAYNAGPRRIRDWLSGRGPLPNETRAYVRLALQLRFLKVSESMGNHDSKIVDAGGVD